MRRSVITHPNGAAFPEGVGGPVLRALAQAEIRTLAQLSKWSEAELAALHGVGAKGIRILGAALKAQGRHFRRD